MNGVNSNLMKVNEDVHMRHAQVMHMRRRKSLQPYRLGSSFPEKALEVMVHSELNVSHQCALATKKDPGLY